MTVALVHKKSFTVQPQANKFNVYHISVYFFCLETISYFVNNETFILPRYLMLHSKARSSMYVNAMCTADVITFDYKGCTSRRLSDIVYPILITIHPLSSCFSCLQILQWLSISCSWSEVNLGNHNTKVFLQDAQNKLQFGKTLDSMKDLWALAFVCVRVFVC